VANASDKKLKRSEMGDELTLNLVANPDILADSVARIHEDGLKVISVGFAAETATSAQELQMLGELKLASKRCDLLVANNVSEGAVFGSDQNSVLVLTKDGSVTSRDGSKVSIANHILDVLSQEI
jgi:phosphopantothenoylcysteine decarboxylase/phosphopantothenate--cysteine ligase